MTDIRELDQATVERIAAGEVVERPASVVKELVENAIDAGASRLEVAVEAGGTEGIRVTDDGVGMTEREVRRAVEEHTTSKIADIGDLEGGVGTLGFRGEALHAVGAVSRLTIRTRPDAATHPSGGGRGTELVVEGGEVVGGEPAGCPEGTTVAVEELFYNVPARRKYLKQESTEFAHVNRVVTSYALANPGVAVSLTHDGRETFATAGRGDLRETVMNVYGREVAESMLSVGDVPDGPLDGVTGLVSHPETNRATRDYLSTFVDGRYVTSAPIRDAVVEAYDTQLAPDRYPFAVLDLAVDPADVDVNVHPRKLEIRWVDEEGVKRQVRTAVEDALRSSGLRSSAPRGRSAPDQTEVAPSSTSEAGGNSGASPTDTSANTGTAESDTSANTGTARVGRSEGAKPDETAGGGEVGDGSTRRGEAEPSSPDTDTDASPAEPSAADSPGPGSHRGGSGPPQVDGPETQTTLGGSEAHLPTEYDSLPDLRVLGQLHDTYVVAEAEDGLVLIDQHAADERVNYERLRERFEGETTTQALADPVAVELTARETALFDTHRDALARLGFRATLVSERTVEVTTVPALVAEAAGPETIRDVLTELVSAGEEGSRTVEAIADDLVADMACYPAVTGNTSLTEGSVVDLLAALDGCENPWACPHGRPVLIHVDGDEIAERFERDYPGHR
jgi:DNA mismatch repair protein MutL